MLNAVAPYPAGDPAASVVVLEAATIPSRLLLALEVEVSAGPQLAQAVSVHVRVVSEVAASLVVVAEAALEAIAEASAEALEAVAGAIVAVALEEIVVAMGATAVVSGFNLMDMGLQMAPQLVLEVLAISAEAAIEAVIVGMQVVIEATDATSAAKDLAVPTMSRWAAGTDTATVIATVGMVAETTLAQGSVATKATVTTIHDSVVGTRLLLDMGAMVCHKVTSPSALLSNPFTSTRVRQAKYPRGTHSELVHVCRG